MIVITKLLIDTEYLSDRRYALLVITSLRYFIPHTRFCGDLLEQNSVGLHSDDTETLHAIFRYIQLLECIQLTSVTISNFKMLHRINEAYEITHIN